MALILLSSHSLTPRARKRNVAYFVQSDTEIRDERRYVTFY